MADDYITRKDLDEFKQNLLEAIDARLTARQSPQRWYKTYQLKKLLSISHGKLQQLRDEGTLPFSRIGNLILYDYADVERMIQAHRNTNSSTLTKQE